MPKAVIAFLCICIKYFIIFGGNGMFNFIVTRNRKKLTLIEISELWLESKKFSVKLSTYCNYRQKFEDYIYPQLGSLKYSEISQTQLNDFIDYLLVSGRKDGKGGLSKGTVKDIITLMKSISKFAHTEYNLKNICVNLNISKVKKTKFKFYQAAKEKSLKHICSAI